MTKSKKLESIERVAKKFMTLQEPEQMYIAGYIARIEEERAKKMAEADRCTTVK